MNIFEDLTVVLTNVVALVLFNFVIQRWLRIVFTPPFKQLLAGNKVQFGHRFEIATDLHG